MQGVFIQALTHHPPVVLGRQLRDFSPWHGLMLEAAGSPYIVGGRITSEDVIYAAWVCALPFSAGYRAASDIKGAVKWGRKQRRADMNRERALVAEYIAQSLSCPEYWRTGNMTQLRGPYWWHLALFAQQALGMSESEAWDHSIMRLVCYRACHSESAGWKGLMSDDDMNGIATLKADVVKGK